MVISGKNRKTEIFPIKINNTAVERVNVTKLVGVQIQSDLKWDIHVDSVVTTASTKLHFLLSLKKAGLSREDLLKFYCSVIRSQL